MILELVRGVIGLSFGTVWEIFGFGIPEPILIGFGIRGVGLFIMPTWVDFEGARIFHAHSHTLVGCALLINCSCTNSENGGVSRNSKDFGNVRSQSVHEQVLSLWRRAP